MTATVNAVILTRRNGRTATAYHIMAEGRKINTFCTALAAIKYVKIYNVLRESECQIKGNRHWPSMPSTHSTR